MKKKFEEDIERAHALLITKYAGKNRRVGKVGLRLVAAIAVAEGWMREGKDFDPTPKKLEVR